MADMDDVKGRIRKIMERTTARGFTEAEAAAAMETAARLMADHGLSEDDLVMAAVDAKRRASFKPHPRDRIAAAVSHGTNCAAVKTMVSYGTSSFTFYGREPAPTLAAYMYDMVETAVAVELRAFQKSTHYKRKRTQRAKARASLAFTEGLVLRLCAKLRERFGGQRDEVAAARAHAYRDSQTGPLSASKAPKASKDHDTVMKGYAAGAGVSLADGVGGKAAPLRIGRR